MNPSRSYPYDEHRTQYPLYSTQVQPTRHTLPGIASHPQGLPQHPHEGSSAASPYYAQQQVQASAHDGTFWAPNTLRRLLTHLTTLKLLNPVITYVPRSSQAIRVVCLRATSRTLIQLWACRTPLQGTNLRHCTWTRPSTRLRPTGTPL
jgi:hypothetical protein